MRRDVLAGLGLAAFALVCLYPVLGAQFVLVDDHEIASYTRPGAGPALDGLGIMIFQSDPAVGRFRPMYWLTRLSEITLLGANPTAWHATILLIGLACAALLYVTARDLGFNRALAFLLGAWLMVAPGVSSVWVRLGPNETFGMLFLCLAAFAAVRAAAASGPAAIAWDTAFVIASIATFLSKESLILMAPALALFRVVVGRRQKCPRPAWLPATSVLVVGLALGMVALVVGRTASDDSYGGGFLVVPDLQSEVLRSAHNLAILAFAGCAWLALLLVPDARWRSSRIYPVDALLVLALVALIVVPQVALYSNQGILEGRYELPAALGLVGLVLAVLRYLFDAGARRLYRVGVGLLAASIALFGISTWSYSTYFTADSQALHQMLAAVRTRVAPDDVIGIAGDPARQYEPILSLATYLGGGLSDPQVKLLPLAPDGGPYSHAENNLVQAMDASPLMAAPSLEQVGCANLKALIVLRQGADVQQALPCLDGAFHQEEFGAQVLLWGGDAVSLRPRLPGVAQIRYVAFVSE